ncbi:lysozyme inhibitor LprI family protein [Methylocella sp.]|uniref:lysozyme inhibitor LprI family protein n=1 Tax=Methylocella sp. TaxID=1978226 RepID=UPI003784068C
MQRLARVFALAALFSAPAAAGVEAPRPLAEAGPPAAEAPQSADGPLNALYRTLIARFAAQPETKAALVEAQRAWLEYRGRECAFAARGSGAATSEAMAEATRQCRRVLTDQRLDRLNAYLAAP